MVLPHDNNLPAFTLIHQKNKTNLNCNKDQNPELIILELETALSGYAAEEAFKKNSFLLRKLSDDDLNINTFINHLTNVY